MASDREDHRDDGERPGGDLEDVAVAPGAAEQRDLLAGAAPRRCRGSAAAATTIANSENASSGTTTSTHSVTTARAHGLSTVGLRVAPAPRQHAEQGRLDAVEQVGDAGDVGQHVVAVEAHQRRQLAHHLQDLGGHDEQQRVVPGDPPDAGDRRPRRSR